MRKIFLENLGLKLAALLLSIVLWIFVTSRGQSEISLNIPLEFTNIPSGLEIVNNTAKTVSLTIKGYERIVRNINQSDISISVDISKAKKGENIIYLDRSEVRLPRAVTVTKIIPSSIKVLIEDTVIKPVTVKPVIVGYPERGYYVKSITVVPQTVVIEGLRPEVRKITAIRTEPLDVTGFRETFEQNLKLDLTGKNIRTKTPDVKVNVVIRAVNQ
jgi:YbbR domain-containing protein